MIRVLSIVALVVFLVPLILQLWVRRERRSEYRPTTPFRGWLEWGAYAAMLLGIAGTALTGLATAAVSSAAMTGWVLMLHATAAPLFAIGVAAFALLWADRYMPGRPALRGQVVFWLVLATSVVVILSAVVPMTPTSGTHGQELWYETHRVSSALLAIFAGILIWQVASSQSAAPAPRSPSVAAGA